MSCSDDIVPIITNVFSLAGSKHGELFTKENQANTTKNISTTSSTRHILPKGGLVTVVSHEPSPTVSEINIQSYSEVDDPFRGIPEKIINDLADSVRHEFSQAASVFITPKAKKDTSIPQTMASTSVTVAGSKSITVASNSNSENDSVKRSTVVDVCTHSKPITTIVPPDTSHDIYTPNKPITTTVPLDGDIKSKNMASIVPLGVIMQENKPIPANYINITDKIPIKNLNPQRILISKRNPACLVRILPKKIAPRPIIPKTFASVKDASSHNVPFSADTLIIPIDKNPLTALHRTVGSINDNSDSTPSVVNINKFQEGNNSCNSVDVRKHDCNVTVKVENDDVEKTDNTDNTVSIDAVPSEKVPSTESIEEDEAKAIAASLFISPADTSLESNELSQSSSTDGMKDTIGLSDDYQGIIDDDSLPTIVSDIKEEIIDNDEVTDDDANDSQRTAIDVDKEKKEEKAKEGAGEDVEVESSSDDDGAYERSDDSEYNPDEEESSSSGVSDSEDDGTSKKKKLMNPLNNLSVSVEISDKMKAIQSKHIPILPATMLTCTINSTKPIVQLPTDTICEKTDVSIVKHTNNPILQTSQVTTPQPQMVIPPSQMISSSQMVIPPSQMIISSSQMVITPAQIVTASNPKDLNCKTTSVCLSQVLDILNMKKNKLPTTTNTNTVTIQPTQQQATQISTQPLNKHLSKTLENIALLKQLEKKQASAIDEARSKLIKSVQNVKKTTSDENITTNIKCEKCNKHMFSLVELVSHKCVFENEIQRALSKSVLENAALQKMAESVINKEKSLSRSIGDRTPVVTSLLTKQPPGIGSRLSFSTEYNVSPVVSQVTSSNLSVASSTVASSKSVNVSHVQTPVAATPVPASLLSTKPTVIPSQVPLSTQTVPMYLVARQTVSGNPGQMMLVSANSGNSSAVPLKLQQIPGGGVQLVAQSTAGVPLLITPNNVKPIYVRNVAPALVPRVRPMVSQVCPVAPQIRNVVTQVHHMSPGTVRRTSSITTTPFIPPAQLNLISAYTGVSSSTSTVQLLKRAQTAPVPITCISSAKCSTSPSNSNVPSVVSETNTTSITLPDISSTVIKKEPSDTNDSGTANVVSVANNESTVLNTPMSTSSSGKMGVTTTLKIDADLPALQFIGGSATTSESSSDPKTNFVLIGSSTTTKPVQSTSSLSNPTIKIPSNYIAKPMQKPSISTFVTSPVLIPTPTTDYRQPVQISSSLINPSISTSVSPPVSSLPGQQNTTTLRIANLNHSISSAIASILPLNVSSAQNKLLPTQFNLTHNANTTLKLLTNSVVPIGNTQSTLSTLKDFAATRSTSSQRPAINYPSKVLNTLPSLSANNISHNLVNVFSTPALQDKKVTVSLVTTSSPTYTVINSLKDTKIAALGNIMHNSKALVGNKVLSVPKSLNVPKSNMFIELNQKHPAVSTSDLSINLIGKSNTSVVSTSTVTATVPVSLSTVKYTNITGTETTNITSSGNVGRIVTGITPSNFVIKNKQLTLVNAPNRVPVSLVNGISSTKPIVQSSLNSSKTIGQLSRPVFRVDLNNPKKLVQCNMNNQTRPQAVQIFNIPRTLTPPKFSNVSIRNVLAVNNSMVSNANKLFLSNSQFIKVDGQQHLYCVISKNNTVSNQHVVLSNSVLPSTSSLNLPSTVKSSVPISLSNPITSYLPTTGPLGPSSQRNIPVTIRPDILKNFPMSMSAMSKGLDTKLNQPTSTSLLDLKSIPIKSETSSSTINSNTVENTQTKNPPGHIPIQLGLTEKLFTMSGKKRLKHQFVGNRYDTKFASAVGFEVCIKELEDEYFNIKKGALNVNIDVRDYLASFWIKKPLRPKVSPRYGGSQILEQHLGKYEKDGKKVSSKCTETNNVVSSQTVSSQPPSVLQGDTTTTQCHSESKNIDSEQRDSKNTETDNGSEKNEIDTGIDEEMLIRKRKNGMLEHHTTENKKQKTDNVSDCNDPTSTVSETKLEIVDIENDTEDIERNIFDMLDRTNNYNSGKRLGSSVLQNNNKKSKTNFTEVDANNEAIDLSTCDDLCENEFVDSDSGRDSVDVDLLTPTKLNPRVIIKKMVEP